MTNQIINKIIRPTIRQPAFFVFCLIGVFNTLFDIFLYVLLLNAIHSILIANLITTTAALIGSYMLNSRFTFKVREWTIISFTGFVIVTLFGLWVLQTSAIYGISAALRYLPDQYWQALGSFSSLSKAVLPKLAATAVTFIWNFVWYNRIIFKNQSIHDQVTIAIEDTK